MFRKALVKHKPEFLILDEAHFVKNDRSERTKAVIGTPTDAMAIKKV